MVPLAMCPAGTDCGRPTAAAGWKAPAPRREVALPARPPTGGRTSAGNRGRRLRAEERGTSASPCRGRGRPGSRGRGVAVVMTASEGSVGVGGIDQAEEDS
jgi:hypothetical protein